MIAAAVVLAAVVALGISLTTGHHTDTADRAPQAPAPTGQGSGAASSPPARSTSPSTSPSASSSGGVHAPARVAATVRGLLAREVAAHQRDNAAVGAMLTCAHAARNERTISSFAATRRQLVRQLAAVPSSSSPQLDGIVHRLLATWRSLTPVDRAYAGWAGRVHRAGHRCYAPAAPATSLASKDQRRHLRDDWVAMLRAHGTWHVSQVRPLVAPRLGYLLL